MKKVMSSKFLLDLIMIKLDIMCGVVSRTQVMCVVVCGVSGGGTNSSIRRNVLLLVQDELTCKSISYSSLRSYLLYDVSIGYSSVSVLVCI